MKNIPPTLRTRARILSIAAGLAFLFVAARPIGTIHHSTTSFEVTSQDSVYICNGPYSKRYHYRQNCRGLSNCSTAITKVSKSAAQRKGRTLCGWED